MPTSRSCSIGGWPTAGPVRIRVEDDAARGEFGGEPGERAAVPQLGHGRLDQGGAVLGVHGALPVHPVEVADELLRRLPVPVEREVLVVDRDARVVEVRVVLPVVGVGGVDLVGALVDVLDPVVEEPVGDEPLALRLHHLAGQRAEAALPGDRIPVLRVRLLLPELGQVAAEHHPEQVPLGAEGGIRIAQLVDDLGELRHIGALIQPGCQAGLAAGGLADDGQPEGVERAGHDLVGGQPERCEPLPDALLQLGRRLAVEGEHQDLLRVDESAVHRVAGLGDHRGGLAGAGGGDQLHPVVEADDGAGLFVGQRRPLDVVEEGPVRLQLLVEESVVPAGDVVGEVGFPQLDRLQDVAGLFAAMLGELRQGEQFREPARRLGVLPGGGEFAGEPAVVVLVRLWRLRRSRAPSRAPARRVGRTPR